MDCLHWIIGPYLRPVRPPDEEERLRLAPPEYEDLELPELDLGADCTRDGEELLEETDGDDRGLGVERGCDR